jgi:hypothetical protein
MDIIFFGRGSWTLGCLGCKVPRESLSCVDDTSSLCTCVSQTTKLHLPGGSDSWGGETEGQGAGGRRCPLTGDADRKQHWLSHFSIGRYYQ